MGPEHPYVAAIAVLGLIVCGRLCAQGSAHDPNKVKEHTTCVAVGDLNGDNKPDVVFGNRREANQVFLNDGKGNFRDLVPEVLATTKGDTTCMALADVDGDHDLDIVFGNDSAEMRLLLNDGKGGFAGASMRLPEIKAAHSRAVVAADVDKDGDLDLIVANFGKPNLLLINDAKGYFAHAKKSRWPADEDYSSCAAVGDMDLDGDLDILFGNHKNPRGQGGDNTLLLNNGKDGFVRGQLPTDRTSTSWLLIADLDGDRLPDILQDVLSKRGGRPKQYKNKGTGTFLNETNSRMPRGRLNVGASLLCNVDGDNRLELVLGARNGSCLLWKNRGDGKFTDITRGNMPDGAHATTALAAADVDGDGDPDLIVANEGEANLLLRNQGGGRFTGDPQAQSFLNKADAADLARLVAIQKKLGFKLHKQADVGGGRYRFRLDGRLTRVDKATASAIEASLKWLAKHQDKDGSWDTDEFMAHDPKGAACDGAGNGVHDVAITALVLLTFMAEGNTPFTGSYHGQVETGFAWLRKSQTKAGVFYGPNHDFIYAHCIATIAVCEGYGLSGDPRLKESAQAGLDYLSAHHSPARGWGYQKAKANCDTSIIGWAVQACRAGEDFGLKVDEGHLRDALAWLHKMTDRDSGRTGYSKKGEYSSRHPGTHVKEFPPENGEAMTAAALLCRYFLGETPGTSSIIKKSVRRLIRKPPKWQDSHVDYYYWFYGSQAMQQHGGDQELTWRKALLTALLPNQRKDGSFAGSFDPVGAWGDDGGRVYSTAIALLSLQAPYRYVRMLGDDKAGSAK